MCGHLSIRIALRGNQCSAILRLSDENMGRGDTAAKKERLCVSACVYTLYKWRNFHWGWSGGTFSTSQFDLVDTVSLNRVASVSACQKPDARKEKVMKTLVEHLIHPDNLPVKMRLIGPPGSSSKTMWCFLFWPLISSQWWEINVKHSAKYEAEQTHPSDTRQ